MSIGATKKSKIDSDAVLSLEENKAILYEGSSPNERYSKIGHLYSGRNTHQFRWFKGSRDRGIRGEVAA